MDKLHANNLSLLTENEYWGRGIIAGNTADGRIAIAYFIMGRSSNSRNRVFIQDGMSLRTKPFDESLVEDPSLIIYYPIKLAGRNLIVTNGDQTDTVEEFLQRGETFEAALRTREFEPDGPHYTPRISAVIDIKTGSYKLSILKNLDDSDQICSRYFYEYEPVPGAARFIHTYEANEEPLRTFEGEPKKLEIPSDLDAFTEQIWNNLDNDNKISLCTLMINPQGMSYDVKVLNKRLGD